MTLNTKIKVFIEFWPFQLAAHISRVNGTAPKWLKINQDYLCRKCLALKCTFS